MIDPNPLMIAMNEIDKSDVLGRKVERKERKESITRVAKGYWRDRFSTEEEDEVLYLGQPMGASSSGNEADAVDGDDDEEE